MNRLHFFFIYFTFITASVLAATSPGVKQFINHKDWNFVENKGQLADRSEIKYYGHSQGDPFGQGGVYVYCKPQMISFVFTKVEKKDEKNISEATGISNSASSLSPFAGGKEMNSQPIPSKISTSRTDLVLLGSNPNALIIATGQQEYCENYYTAGDADHGITDVHTFKSVTYKNIYPNIEMVLNCSEQGMEYSFIIHPGGKVSDIQLQWNGMDAAKALSNGGFKFSNDLGEIEESCPKSFVEGKAVKSNFFKKGFNVSRYDHSKDLVIDPTVKWSTYYGGNGGDQGNGVCTDDSGYVYIVGFTYSNTGIATSGAYRSSFLLNTNYGDAFIAKFNRNDKRLWGTYFGGISNDVAQAIAADKSDNIYIVGTTASTSAIATSGAFQTSNKGNNDAFLAKFSSGGQRRWATYVGGSGSETGTSLVLDDSANVYLAGTTTSSSGIATYGALLTSYSGNNDAFLAKFDSSGSRKWATYYGGDGYDQINGICTDNKGNIFVTGYTTSDTGIATSGAYQTSITTGGSGQDAFLAKFYQNGSLIWGTYFGGSDIDGGQAITLDSLGYIYLTGVTASQTHIATKGSYQTSLAGDYDGFVTKFNTNDSMIWSTYYGGTGWENNFSGCILLDPRGNICISGNTDSRSGIATSGSYQSSLGSNNGDNNVYLAQLSNDGMSLLWATYLGGDGGDAPYGIAKDTSGNIYIAGTTQSSSGIATPGAFLNSEGYYGNAFLTSFNFLNTDVGINQLAPFCSDSQIVLVQLTNYGFNEIDSVQIGWSVNRKAQKVLNWKGKLKSDSIINVSLGKYLFTTGIDTIKYWISKPNGITSSTVPNDTSLALDTIVAPPIATFASDSEKICSGSNVRLQMSVTNVLKGQTWALTYRKSGSNADSTFKGTGYGTFYLRTSALTSETDYTLISIFKTSGNTQCSNPLSSKTSIIIKPVPAASVIASTTICQGPTISIGATAVTGISYSWTSSSSGYSSTLSNPSVTPVTTTSYTLTAMNSIGCSSSNSLTITVNPLPVASVIPNKAICLGSGISIGANPVSGSSYSWTSSISGFSSTVSNPSVSPASTSSYTLTETSAKGCTNSNSVIITVNPLPTATVANNATICSGAPTSIGGAAVSGYTYSWSSSVAGFSSTASNPVVTPNVTTLYKLTVTNSYNCSNSYSLILTVNSLPAASVIANTAICVGKTISIGAAAVSGSTYSWSSSNSGFSSTNSNPSVSPTSTSVYTLTETNLNGCSNSDTVKITVNPLPAAYVIPDSTICLGSAIALGSSSVLGSIYSWTSSGSGGTSHFANLYVSPTSATSYTLTETNSNGCVNSNSVTIKVNPLPTAAVIAGTTICAGTPVLIGSIAVSGSSYSWVSSPPGFSSTVSNPSVSPNSTRVYVLTETSSNGCSKSDSVKITVNPLPTAAVIQDTSICSGSTISIGSQAVLGSSYSWSSSNSGFVSTISNPSVSLTSTRTYTLTETNSNGCVKSDSVTIIVDSLPPASVIQNATVCSGSTIPIGAITIPGHIYSWVGSISGFKSKVANPYISPTSTSTYTLTETGLNGCSNSNSVKITVNVLPDVLVIPDSTICKGYSLSLGSFAVSGNTYSWTSNPSGFVSKASNPSVIPLVNTIYALKVTIKSTGCSASDSTLIRVNPSPKSGFSYLSVCPGDSSVFSTSLDTGSSTSSFKWYFGDGDSSSQQNPSHLYTALGNYMVSLKEINSFGCIDSVSKTLSISNCVLPGDANDDKVVDMNDLLAVGIAYGTVGHPRPNASIIWTAQPSPDWSSSFPNGINYKFADCNGDSLINYEDTLAISTNYDLSHPKSGINQGSTSDPVFSLKYLKDTFYAGDTLVAQIILGSNSKPVTNLYGLTFSVAPDPSIFESNKAFLKPNSSFLGTSGSDMICLVKNNAKADTIDIGLCRIDHLNVSGNGTIASLYIPVKATLSQKYVRARVLISNNYQISYNENLVPLYLTSDSVLLKQDHTGIENAEAREPFLLSIFPNPFQSTTTITYSLNHNSKINIVLIDITGKQIGTILNDTQIQGNYQFDINAEKYHLTPGIYLLKFMMDDEVVSRRMVKF